MSTDGHRKIEAAAGDWFAKRDSGDWTDADQVRFDRWLNESAVNRVAFLRIEHVWERAQRLKALGAGIRPGDVPPPGQWVLSPFFNRTVPDNPRTPGSGTVRKRLAASILLTAAISAAWYLWPAASDYRTPIGGLASVPMSDGSKVTLNTDSEIRVAVTAKERRVELEQGEAFFEVAKDPTRPFVVRAGNRRVIAVGTKFSVRRDADDIQVVVTEGTVRLESPGVPLRVPGNRSAARIPPGEDVSAESLTAGTIARASDTGVLLQKQQPAEAEESLSWRAGILVFREVTLAEAIAEFNRYNTRKIVITDPGVAALRVAGNFRATNVDAFVRLLERGYPLHVEQRGDQFILKAH